MHAIINPAYHHLLPLHGTLYPVEHMYRNGNPNKATIKLIKELFYLQEDGVSFRPTILKSKPASYWTPKDIGILIVAITAYRANKTDDYLFGVTLEQIMQPQKEMMHTQEKDITARINAQKEILQDITQQNKKLFTLIGQTERKPCITTEQLNQKITTLEQLHTDHCFLVTAREPIEKNIKKLKYHRKFIKHTLHSGITDLIGYFLDSIKESAPENSEHTYDAYTTEHVLLAFLWKIANPRTGEIPKQDFVDYFNELGTRINVDNLDAWIVAEPYCLKDYMLYKFLSVHPELVEGSNDNPETSTSSARTGFNNHDSPQQYEQTLLAQLAQSVWESPLPPIITGAGAKYTDKDGNQTEQSPECVETSFRNFLNMILYNAKKKIFDIERLCTAPQEDKEFPLQPNQHVINFYKKDNCVTNLQASELYNAWANVLTNLSDIIYMKPEEYAQRARFYEVKSLLPNMLKVCNHLLFGNNQHINQLPPAKQLDILCDAVSRDDFVMTWDIIDEQIKKEMVANCDYVTLKFFINDTHSFEWQLKKGHSVIPRIDTLHTL